MKSHEIPENFSWISYEFPMNSECPMNFQAQTPMNFRLSRSSWAPATPSTLPSRPSPTTGRPWGPRRGYGVGVTQLRGKVTIPYNPNGWFTGEWKILRYIKNISKFRNGDVFREYINNIYIYIIYDMRKCKKAFVHCRHHGGFRQHHGIWRCPQWGHRMGKESPIFWGKDIMATRIHRIWAAALFGEVFYIILPQRWWMVVIAFCGFLEQDFGEILRVSHQSSFRWLDGCEYHG